MAEMRNGDLPLTTIFEQARQIHSAASHLTVVQDKIKRACDLLHQCEAMIDRLGLFSPNEGKEDISTTDLKYLLVPYYLGELTEKIQNSNRLQIIRTSQLHLKEFISICEKLEVVPSNELEALVQEANDTPEARRAKKIARFKRQKSAESKLQDIKKRKECCSRSRQAAAITTTIEHGDEIVLDDDGEEEREAWLTTISLALCKALDLLDGLKKEEELVSSMIENNRENGQSEEFQAKLEERSQKAEAWHKESASRSRYGKPTQPITCAAFAKDVLEGRAKPSQVNEHKHEHIFGPVSLISGNLTTEREQIVARVFQPSHRMPTMSIEQAGMREMEMMNKWQERTKKQLEEMNSSWYKDGEKDETSDDEAAEEKARELDDWKDDNPRGAGNKKLTPCG
uniref:TSA: Wollemia nobilis Ref_Wollemi_Transcript_4449_1593 transcribed RNA sequence n=1 Tax=Wollemia nobilis TaxID=56998 RepID=A0A0C9QW85_9CONI